MSTYNQESSPSSASLVSDSSRLYEEAKSNSSDHSDAMPSVTPYDDYPKYTSIHHGTSHMKPSDDPPASAPLPAAGAVEVSGHITTEVHIPILNENRQTVVTSLPKQRSSRKTDDVHVGNYRFLRTIGKGNFAKVKLAIHVPTNEEVAVKIIDKSQMTPPNLQKLYREVRIMKQVNHPNIVKLYEVIDKEKTLYLVMEYASGGEVFDFLVNHGRMKEKEARVKFRQIVSAVQYCHQKHIVHRDLKAENLLLDANLNIKIADFGFANEFKMGTKLDTFCGSPPYAAPELFQGKRYDGPEVDVWSLGVILYTLVSGALPFDGHNLKDLRERVLRGKYRIPFYMSTDCEALLKKMLILNPAKRQTLDQIMQDRWMNIGFEDDPLIPYVEPFVEYDDEIRIQMMEKMGFSRLLTQSSLHEDKFDNVAATYFLLKRCAAGDMRGLSSIKDHDVDKHVSRRGNDFTHSAAAVTQPDSIMPNCPPSKLASEKDRDKNNWNASSAQQASSVMDTNNTEETARFPKADTSGNSHFIRHGLRASDRPSTAITSKYHNASGAVENENSNSLALNSLRSAGHGTRHLDTSLKISNEKAESIIESTNNNTSVNNNTNSNTSATSSTTQSMLSRVNPLRKTSPRMPASYMQNTTASSRRSGGGTSAGPMPPGVSIISRTGRTEGVKVSDAAEPGDSNEQVLERSVSRESNAESVGSTGPNRSRPISERHTISSRAKAQSPSGVSSSLSTTPGSRDGGAFQRGDTAYTSLRVPNVRGTAVVPTSKPGPNNNSALVSLRNTMSNNQCPSGAADSTVNPSILPTTTITSTAFPRNVPERRTIHHPADPALRKNSNGGEDAVHPHRIAVPSGLNQVSQTTKSSLFKNMPFRLGSGVKPELTSSSSSNNNPGDTLSSELQSIEPLPPPLQSSTAGGGGGSEEDLPSASGSTAESSKGTITSAFSQNNPSNSGNSGGVVGVGGGGVAQQKPRSLRFTFSMRTTSSRDPNEMVEEIKRVLTLKQVIYEQRERYLLVCECTDSKTNTDIQWEMEICKLPRLSLNGVRVKRIAGSSLVFKSIVSDITNALQL